MEKNLAKVKAYSRTRMRLMVLEFVVGVAFLVMAIVSGLSSYLAKLTEGWTGNFYLQLAMFVLIFSVAYYLLTFWLDFYRDYTIEHKFGLSKQGVGDWIKQHTKKTLLGFVLVVGFFEGLYVLVRNFPDTWWLIATGAWVLVGLIIGRVLTTLIIPIFYKLSPVEDEELQGRLLELGKRCGVSIGKVCRIELGAETEKANAAVAGLGKSRRILLSDTLLENYEPEEIEAVFAHELGHIYRKHTVKIFLMGTGLSLISFYVTFRLYKAAVEAGGYESLYDISAMPLLTLLLILVSIVALPGQNAFMRVLEKEADIFAASKVQDSESFVSAITKLSEQNLADPQPSGLVKMLFSDHPPVSERIRYVRGLK